GAVADRPIKRRRGQRHVEGNTIVLRRQRLQIGSDLVRHVPGARGSIRSDYHQIDLAALHQMSAGVVCDDGMRHTVLTKLPGRELGSLIAWSGLIDPNVDG